MWICSKCKTENSDNYNFCNNCGNPKPKDRPADKSWVCSNCKNENNSSDNFCKFCGYKNPAGTTAPGNKALPYGIAAVVLVLILSIVIPRLRQADDYPPSTPTPTPTSIVTTTPKPVSTPKPSPTPSPITNTEYSAAAGFLNIYGTENHSYEILDYYENGDASMIEFYDDQNRLYFRVNLNRDGGIFNLLQIYYEPDYEYNSFWEYWHTEEGDYLGRIHYVLFIDYDTGACFEKRELHFDEADRVIYDITELYEYSGGDYIFPSKTTRITYDLAGEIEKTEVFD